MEALKKVKGVISKGVSAVGSPLKDKILQGEDSDETNATAAAAATTTTPTRLRRVKKKKKDANKVKEVSQFVSEARTEA